LKTAFIFPGQGSQIVGMGKDLFENTELGKSYFLKANEIMQCELTSIIFQGPEETLRETKFTQPALYVVSVILGKLLLEKGIKPDYVAGHSLGEFSALTVANSIDFETGLKLVKSRANAMFEAGKTLPGTMAAIVGLTDETITSICDQGRENGTVVTPANFNAPGQVVISGDIQTVRSCMKLAKKAGAKLTIELNVSGAFHSALMLPAKQRFAQTLNSSEIMEAEIPIFLNVTAQSTTHKDYIKSKLLQQLDHPVLWSNSINNMISNHVTRFIEVGPGKVLCGLNRRIDKSVLSQSIGDLTKLDSCLI
jgi:[acyl-carrier-protein] S-malonyltransferase